MKSISAILLTFIFLVNCIMVPFCNFQDTVSTKILYSQFLQNDSDGNVLEFITNNILHIGDLFDNEDDDEDVPLQQSPASQQDQHPFQPIQITPGFLYCAQALTVEDNEPPEAPRVFCFFVANNYELDYSSLVFHPPAFPRC